MPEFFDLDTALPHHFVALVGKMLEFSEAGLIVRTKDFARSAFIMEVDDAWLLVTAGHVLEQINDHVAHARMKFECRLGDYFGKTAIVRESPIFEYDPRYTFFINTDDFDIGFFPIMGLALESIKRNNITPMPISLWTDSRLPQFERYLILGIPEHKQIDVAASATNEAGLEIHLGTLPIEALPPVVIPDLDAPKFVGKVLDSKFKSVDGMSGGPIIGVRANRRGGLEYGCVAVQHGWLPESRQVSATPINVVLGIIRHMMDRAIKEGWGQE